MMVVGRVAVKVTGRDAGTKVVVVKNIDDVFAEVVDVHGRRSKVNKRHLLPLREVISVEGKSDEEIAKELGAA